MGQPRSLKPRLKQTGDLNPEGRLRPATPMKKARAMKNTMGPPGEFSSGPSGTSSRLQKQMPSSVPGTAGREGRAGGGGGRAAPPNPEGGGRGGGSDPAQRLLLKKFNPKVGVPGEMGKGWENGRSPGER